MTEPPPSFDDLRAAWRAKLAALGLNDLAAELAELALKVERGEPTGSRDADLVLEGAIRLGTAMVRPPTLVRAVHAKRLAELPTKPATPEELRAAIADGQRRDAAELELAEGEAELVESEPEP